MFNLPRFYKLFNDVYLINSIPYLGDFYSYFHKNYSFKKIFSEYYFHFSHGHMFVDTYFYPEELKEKFSKVINLEDEWEKSIWDQQLLPIGITQTNQLLLLGIGEHNADEIYQETRWDQTIIKYADNIFEYCSKIEVVPETNQKLPDLNVLYKNWNEDFWRVREEGDATKIIEEKNKEIAEIKKDKDNLYFKLKTLAREEKKNGVPLSSISEKYGFSIEDLEKPFF